MHKRTVTIVNEAGFHIRPAQLVSEKASAYESTILIKPEGTTNEANAKSILNLMTLGLAKGAVVHIEAEGPDEREAVDEISLLVESGFGEA